MKIHKLEEDNKGLLFEKDQLNKLLREKSNEIEKIKNISVPPNITTSEKITSK